MQEVYIKYLNTCDECLPFRIYFMNGDNFSGRWVEKCDNCGISGYNMPLNESMYLVPKSIMPLIEPYSLHSHLESRVP